MAKEDGAANPSMGWELAEKLGQARDIVENLLDQAEGSVAAMAQLKAVRQILDQAEVEAMGLTQVHGEKNLGKPAMEELDSPELEEALRAGAPIPPGQQRILFIQNNYGGPYITLREAKDKKGNCGWINTRHQTLDLRRPPAAKGIQLDIWGHIVEAMGSPAAARASLPEGVLPIALKGATQHNAGSGYSLGLKGFATTESILRWLAGIFELRVVETSNATYCLRHLSDIIHGYEDLTPDEVPQKKVFLHNRDSSGNTLDQALTLKDTALFTRNNLGVMCMDRQPNDSQNVGDPSPRQQGPCTLYIRDELRAIIEEAGGTVAEFLDNPTGRTPQVQGAQYHHMRTFPKPSDCLNFLRSCFDVLPGSTNISELDLNDLDHYEPPENKNTAFGQALLDATWNPKTTFILKTKNAPPLTVFPAKEYFKLRDDEEKFLEEAIAALPPQGRVLDLGCGIGRHLNHIRTKRPDAHLFGIEKCEGLVQHCKYYIAPPAHFAQIDLATRPTGPGTKDAFTQLEALLSLQTPADSASAEDSIIRGTVASGMSDPATGFDLILLLGDTLGVFGDAAKVKGALVRLVNLLNPGGTIRLETGNWFPNEFDLLEQEIHYNCVVESDRVIKGKRDTEILWGGATEQWLRRICAELNITCEVADFPRFMDIYFFATLRRPEPPHKGPTGRLPQRANSATHRINPATIH